MNLMKLLALYNQSFINPLLNSLSKTGRVALLALVWFGFEFSVGWSYLASSANLWPLLSPTLFS